MYRAKENIERMSKYQQYELRKRHNSILQKIDRKYNYAEILGPAQPSVTVKNTSQGYQALSRN